MNNISKSPSHRFEMGFNFNIVLKVFIMFGFCFTQTITTAQESIFDDYYKLNLTFNGSRYIGGERSSLPNTLNYEFTNFTSPTIGLAYDIYRHKNFNFRIGISTTLIREKDKFFIDQLEYQNGTGDISLETETITDGQWRVNLPVTGEYLIPLGKSILLTINTSIILGFHEEFGDADFLFEVGGETSEVTSLAVNYSRSTAPWYLNGRLGFGAYFPFNGWMLRTNLFYNRAFQELYEGTFVFNNTQQSGNVNGDVSFRGDSFGIEFSIYLAKKISKKMP